MNKFRILDLVNLIYLLGLSILFLYYLFIKEYSQSVMCIIFLIAPLYGIVLRVKNKNRLM